MTNSFFFLPSALVQHTLNRLENLLDGWTPPDPDHPHTTTEPPMTNGNHHASPPASHEDDA